MFKCCFNFILFLSHTIIRNVTCAAGFRLEGLNSTWRISNLNAVSLLLVNNSCLLFRWTLTAAPPDFAYRNPCHLFLMHQDWRIPEWHDCLSLETPNIFPYQWCIVNELSRLKVSLCISSCSFGKGNNWNLMSNTANLLLIFTNICI